jgi:hypothetical protein
LVALSPGIKQPVCEAHLPRPSSAEVKNEYSCMSTPTYAFMACTRTTLLTVLAVHCTALMVRGTAVKAFRLFQS